MKEMRGTIRRCTAVICGTMLLCCGLLQNSAFVYIGLTLILAAAIVPPVLRWLAKDDTTEREMPFEAVQAEVERQRREAGTQEETEQ